MGGFMPRLSNTVRNRPSTFIDLGGYDHNISSVDGSFWDMKNMCAEYYPGIGTRKARYLIDEIENPNGLICSDDLYYVDGTGFYKSGTRLFSVSDSPKSFTVMGAYIVMLPDKMFYNTLTGAYGNIESGVTGQSVTIQNGSFAEESAEANTIYSEAITWSEHFNVGDAVTISGCTIHPQNNLTIIIREIDGHYLRFYENSFVIGEGGDSESSVSIKREMPDIDFMCEHNNRLWGCKGDTIYSSKLGDIFNWNVFDGLSTDSYQVSVGSSGDFTACCSYLGYPCFFKEEMIYKVYGDKPSAYEVMSSANLGVEEGSHRSFGIAGETLFYLSRIGVVAYTGGIPAPISSPFGEERYSDAVGGSDGVRYYVSMKDVNDRYHLFVYDTQKHLWHKEDGIKVVGFGWNKELYFLDSEGNLWMNGNARPENVPEGCTRDAPVPFRLITNDYVCASMNRKGFGKIQLRMWVGEGTEVSIFAQYDNDEVWTPVATIVAERKRNVELPMIPRRSDRIRFKFKGTGAFILLGLSIEGYVGSERF